MFMKSFSHSYFNRKPLSASVNHMMNAEVTVVVATTTNLLHSSVPFLGAWLCLLTVAKL